MKLPMFGFSILFSIGKFCKPNFEMNVKDYPFICRFVIGWFSLIVVSIDLDMLLGNMLMEYKEPSKDKK